jgi:hypothetical protein
MNVIALNPTEITKSGEKGFYLQISRRDEEKADAGDSLRWLRACRQRPRQCPTGQRKEFASLHCHSPFPSCIHVSFDCRVGR